ncbi:MAG: outer membrane lipoprotein-sorting protein [Acidobacteriota bacterium]
MKRLMVFLIFLALPLAAEEGAAILARVDRARNPMESFSVDVELTSYVNDKSETSRFRVFGKGSDRSVVEFTYPQSEKGKYLLMLRDAMWIYMPSASRPIRISPMQRLMGQASNGDVARTSFAVDYNAVAVSEEMLDGREASVLDLVAKDPAVAYGKVRLWVDRTSAEPMRADFYVVSGKLIKRALYREYGEMSGLRVVTKIEIEDLLRPHNRTVMQYSKLAPRQNDDKLFTKDGLGKW